MTVTAEAALESEARQIDGWIRPQPGDGQAQPQLGTIGPDRLALDTLERAGQVIHRAAKAPRHLGHRQARRRMGANQGPRMADEFVPGLAAGSHATEASENRASAVEKVTIDVER